MVTEERYNGPLRVRVQTLQGQSAEVQTWGHRSVMQFKAILSRVWGLGAEDMHLVFREQLMRNERTLGSYMTNDATVTLVPRLSSGF